MKNNRLIKVFTNGLLNENPTFRLLLGMCPTLAITKAASSGLGMGLATTFVLVFSNLVVSLLRNIIPEKVRIPSYVVVIATFVTIIDLLIKAFLPALSSTLGIYIPLIVVNCIIFARAESFASKNPVLPSIADGLGMGLGFTVAITILSCIREVLGNGTISNPELAYHMELPFHDETMRLNLAKCLLKQGLPVKQSHRKEHGYLYYKQCEQIITFLTAVGAHKAVMQIEELRVKRQVYGGVTRAMNCDNANMNKSMDASEAQIAAIEKLVQEGNTGGHFRDFHDFCQRMSAYDLNKRVLENLIRCGAFDSMGARRAQLLQVYESGAKIGKIAYLECTVDLEYDKALPENAVSQLEALFARNELVVEKKGKNGPTDQDIIPMYEFLKEQTSKTWEKQIERSEKK